MLSCFREKAMAPHSSTLAWKIPWMEESGRLQSMGSLRVRHDWAFHFSLSCIGEGNDNPLQCSCLENPRDGGAWWAAVYGVTQGWTRLKRLSRQAEAEWQNHGLRLVFMTGLKRLSSSSSSELLQLCPTLCDPMDCSLPGSSVHGILQARILEWFDMPSSRGSSWPGVWAGLSYVSWIGRRFFTTCSTWETFKNLL